MSTTPKRVDVTTLRRLPTVEAELKLPRGRLARQKKAGELETIDIDGVAHLRDADVAKLRKRIDKAAADAAKPKKKA